MTSPFNRAGGSHKFALLFGSASILAMAGASGARAQTAPAVAAAAVATAAATATADAPPEEVIITGSHIRGVQLVGTPVTTLTDKEFKEEGAVTIGDLFENIPQVVMIADSNVINGGGYVARDQNINIRNLSQKGTRTLMMVDGMRFPNQGNGGCQTDPSIIPQLAVDHVDVLTEGASSEYGSDGVAGVVNVVLKRGYEGLTAQASYNTSQDLGGARKTISGLLGKKWEIAGQSGDVTLSLEHYDTDHIRLNSSLANEFTANYALYGFDNRMAFSNSTPGILSVGNPTAVTGASSSLQVAGTNCGNCFSVPKGQNGVGLTWAQIQANPGVSNEYNNFSDGWISPSQTRDALSVTLDQDLTPSIQAFADGWFSNRRTTMHSQSGGLSNYPLLASYNNPYYPIGAPASLVLNVDLTLQQPIVVSTKEIADRFDAGFNVSLPFSWKAKITGSNSEIHEWNETNGSLTKANVLAALGAPATAPIAATASTPFVPAVVKPSNVPYLNPFCDANAFTACNSAATLAFMTGYSYSAEEELVRELSFTADGPIVQLPGGMMKAAVGAIYTGTVYKNIGQSTNGNDAQVINNTFAGGTRYVGSAFAQLNVPIIGASNNFLLVRKLDADIEVRYDNYNQFGSTINPKFALDWLVGWGFTVKGSVGTSFRAPSFQENANGGASTVNAAATANAGAGVAASGSNSVGTCTAADLAAHKATPGTIAAIIDPNCTQALQFLGGLSLLNSAQSAAPIRPGGVTLTPEKGYNMDVVLDFAPKADDGPVGFLHGLDLQATYWRLKLVNKLQGYFGLAAVTSGTLDTPAYTPAFLTYATDPNFAQHVAALVNSAYSSLPTTVTAANSATPTSGVAFIADGAIRNIGWQFLDGIDFQADYKWRMAGILGGIGSGAWNTGVTGSYSNSNISNGGPGQANVNYYTLNNDGRTRYRAHLGWASETDKGAGWGVIGFVNYIPHFNPLTNPLPPSCFLVGQPVCNPTNASQLAGYNTQYASIPTYVKDAYSWDLNISYNTADLPKSTYLKNIRATFTVQNIFNRRPPYEYEISPPGGGAPHAFYTSTATQELSIGGRSFNFTVTKQW